MDQISCDVVVIGAGCAGLAAAVRLANAGKKVVVLEQGPRLGGRATAFTDRETGERVDNGQHVLFGCYRETYAMLATLGTDGLAPLQPQLAIGMADADGRYAQLSCPAWTPPWHLAAGVLRWRALALRDRLSVLSLASVLRAARRDGPAAVAARVAPNQTVSEWLVAHGQTPSIRQWLWNPLAIAALNQSPDIAAAAPFVRVLCQLFGPRADDSAIGLPTVPLDALYAEPARAFIEKRGGSVMLKSPVRLTMSEIGGVGGISTGATAIAARHVISAVPWHALEGLWGDGIPSPMDAIVRNAAAMEPSPIVTVNLWLDGPSNIADRFVGLINGPMHWVFDKAALYGHGGNGHLSVVASGATELTELDNPGATSRALQQLSRALPSIAGRRLVRSVVVREQRATFSLVPGGPKRPSHRTPLSNFFLAGDWTDTGLPATIEGAVLSGHVAADAVLAAT